MKTIIEQSFDHVFLCDVVKLNDKEEPKKIEKNYHFGKIVLNNVR